MARPSKPGSRVSDSKLGVELNVYWVPFLAACNDAGVTRISPAALSHPLRLAKDADGEVKLSRSARPVQEVNPELFGVIETVKHNAAQRYSDTQLLRLLSDYAVCDPAERGKRYGKRVVALFQPIPAGKARDPKVVTGGLPETDRRRH